MSRSHPDFIVTMRGVLVGDRTWHRSEVMEMVGVTAGLTRFVLTWLSTATGGAERSVGELAAALAGFGHQVALVWWDATGTAKCARPRGVTVRRVGDLAGYRRAVSAELASGQWSVLIGTHRTALVDIPLARDVGVPTIAVLRALLLDQGRLRILDADTGRLLRRAPWTLDWSVLGAADCWVGVSHAAAASLTTYVPSSTPVKTIYNGIPIGPAPRHDLRPVRRFIVAARAEKWKRVDRALEAFAVLPRATRARVGLDVVGDGAHLPALRDLAVRVGIADRTVFHGHVDSGWTSLADVLVSGCEFEAFGRVVVEAGAAGLPQIVPDRGGPAELVVPGLTGLHYTASDPNALARALITAANWHPQELRRRAVAARHHACGFSTEACADAYRRLATSLLTNRPGNPAVA